MTLEPLDLDAQVDGLWSSFAAAYFADLPAALASAAHLPATTEPTQPVAGGRPKADDHERGL